MNGELTGLKDIFKSYNDYSSSVTLLGRRDSENEKEVAPHLGDQRSHSWQEQVKSLYVDSEKTTVGCEDNEPSKSALNSPLVSSLERCLKATFNTSNPLSEPLDHVICDHCRKPVLRQSFGLHLKECAKELKEKSEAVIMDVSSHPRDSLQKQSGGTEESPTNTDAGMPNISAKSEKKRKASEEQAETESNKKLKKAKKQSVTKPRGPVDIEKQCGVPLPNGGFCARSLTCKSHSMGAKRAVPGRSQSYDVLLSAYQKKNQVKQATKAMHAAAAATAEELKENSQPVDSDEEVSLMMEAVSRNHPRPLERHIIMPAKLKNRFFRVREMLSGALGTRASHISTGSGGILGQVIPFQLGGSGARQYPQHQVPNLAKIDNSGGALPPPNQLPSSSAPIRK